MKRGIVFLALALLAVLPLQAQSEDTDGNLPPVPDFRIGIEDRLRVSVWGEDALTLSVFVRPDGKITFPLVNDVLVLGKTPEEVRIEITERLKPYIRDPNVTVMVEDILSFRIYILGEVAGKGVHQFRRPVRLLQAIASAGGFTQFSKKELTILRESGSSELRIRVNYKKLIAGEPGAENIYLKPGDTLLVD